MRFPFLMSDAFPYFPGPTTPAAESPGLSSSAPSPGAPWLRRNKPPPPPPPPPRSHSFSEEQHDFALVAHSASSTHKQLSAAELSLLQRAKDVQRLEAQLKLLQVSRACAFPGACMFAFF